MRENIVLGAEEYFPGIPKIKYEGRDSKNSLAFKFYDETRIVAGKSMREHFRFSVAYWHTLCGTGGDPFGPGTKVFPWDKSLDPMQASFDRLDAAFEFFTKLGIPFYCFHDRDIAPEGSSIKESDNNLDQLVRAAKIKQEESGINLLWGTANLFSHPRYMNGAATNPDFSVVAQAAAQVKSAIDATIFLGGIPMIADDMISFIKNDIIVFGIGVLLFIILTLWYIFKKIIWIIIPISSCFFSVLIMMGLLGLIGWKVTVISSNFIALMLILTMAMNIHMSTRFLQLKKNNPSLKKSELILMTSKKMVWPIIYTVLTTICAFLSLIFSELKPIIDFGWMMSAGLAVTFLASFLMFPSLLMVTGKRGSDPTVDSGRFLLPTYLASLTETHGNKILVFALVLVAVSLGGITQLRVENSFINYFSADTEIHQGLKLIDEKLGGTTPLEILIRFPEELSDSDYFLEPEDLEGLTEEEIQMELEFAAMEREFAATANSPEYWFTAYRVDLIRQVHDYLDGLPEIGKVTSLVSPVRVAENLAEEELDEFELAILYTKIPPEVKGALIDPYVSIDDNEARIVARVLDSKPDLRRNELLEKIQRDLREKLGFEEQEVVVSGLLVLYNNMLQSLFVSQIKTIGAVMLGIAIMFLVLFRSISLAIIGILPNVLGAVVVLGVMGWAKIPMDMMTITIAAITIGIAVDNGIHYIYRFREEYEHTNDYVETLRLCHSNIGKAVFYTAMTIIFGFSILVLSNFIPTVYFGVLIASAMFIAFLAALTVLPKLILLWKPFG